MVVKDKEFKVWGPIPLGWLWMVLIVIGFAATRSFAHIDNKTSILLLVIPLFATLLYIMNYFLRNIFHRSVYWYTGAEGNWLATYVVFPTNAQGLIFKIPVAGWGNKFRAYLGGKERLWWDNRNMWFASASGERTRSGTRVEELIPDQFARTVLLRCGTLRAFTVRILPNGVQVLLKERINGEMHYFVYDDGDMLAKAISSGPVRVREQDRAWQAMAEEVLSCARECRLHPKEDQTAATVLKRVLEHLKYIHAETEKLDAGKESRPVSLMHQLAGRVEELEAAPEKLKLQLYDLMDFVLGAGRVKEMLQRTKSGKLLFAQLIVMAWETLGGGEHMALGITAAMHEEAKQTLAAPAAKNGKPATAPGAAPAGQGGGQG